MRRPGRYKPVFAPSASVTHKDVGVLLHCLRNKFLLGLFSGIILQKYCISKSHGAGFRIWTLQFPFVAERLTFPETAVLTGPISHLLRNFAPSEIPVPASM